MRVSVGAAERGSQCWIQRLVNRAPHLIDGQICPPLGASQVIWRSPLATDDYAEYRDQSALDRMGVTLQ